MNDWANLIITLYSKQWISEWNNLIHHVFQTYCCLSATFTGFLFLSWHIFIHVQIRAVKLSQHEAPRSLFCLTCRNQRESTCLVRQLTTKANQWKYVACLKISYILVSTDTISFFFFNIHSCESCRILFKNNGLLEYLLSTFFFLIL